MNADDLYDLEENEWLIDERVFILGNAKHRICGKGIGKNVRVEQIGPYRIAFRTNDSIENRVNYYELKKCLKSLQEKIEYPIYIGGSQSPLSLKKPNCSSDIDVYVVTPKLSYTNYKDIANLINSWKCSNTERFSIGLIEEDWLLLPYFYEAVPLNEQYWWSLSEAECEAYALQRKRRSMDYVNNLNREDIVSWINNIYGTKFCNDDIIQITTTPRWKSINDCFFKYNI